MVTGHKCLANGPTSGRSPVIQLLPPQALNLKQRRRLSLPRFRPPLSGHLLALRCDNRPWASRAPGGPAMLAHGHVRAANKRHLRESPFPSHDGTRNALAWIARVRSPVAGLPLRPHHGSYRSCRVFTGLPTGLPAYYFCSSLDACGQASQKHSFVHRCWRGLPDGVRNAKRTRTCAPPPARRRRRPSSG